MFDPRSRYANVPEATLEEPSGRRVVYKRRRFVPPADAYQTLAEVTVTEGERLDQITARTLGDPEQFWQVADANGANHPRELTSSPGRTVRIPVPRR